MRTFALCLLIATAAAAEKTVAIVPVEERAGALSSADAAAITQEIRSAAQDALAAHGYSVSDASGAPASVLASGAAAVLFGRAAKMEGATVVAVGVYLPGSAAPAAIARVVGIGLDQLRADARAKIPPLVTKALGLAPATAEPAPTPGTLRIPGGKPQPQQQQAQAQPPPAPAPAPPAPREPPTSSGDPLVDLIREVTSDVEQLRGLRRKQNLKVEILDDKLFAAALRQKAEKELTPAIVAAERARWTAFALAPPNVDPGEILLGVLDEQVAGFYDPFTKQLIVRKEPPASSNLGPDGLRLILAHEIEHALQDQNFGIPDPKTLPDDDVRLARTALLEGDAMAVMTAYGARRANKPIKPALLGGAAMLKAVDAETLLKLSGKSPALLKAPAILREELVLPYAAGYALVAEVYRRGGFALVDKMFRNPPLSSHQVLHPEAYFAGEQPAPVATPAAPPGTRVVTSGRMGELGTRVALEVCVERSVVREFAGRWGGDAYTVVEGPKHALSLLWTSAWTGDSGKQMANLMELEQPCWEDAASPILAGASKVGSEGNVVAVARGSVDLPAAVSRQLAVRVKQPAPVLPLGEVPAPPEIQPARVEQGQFVSPRLALRGEVPEGYAADTAMPAEISIQRAAGGSATLAFVPDVLRADALDAFFQATSGQIASAQNTHLTFLGADRQKLAGLAAEERTWVFEGTRTKLRIDVAPFCGGKASLTLVRIEPGDTARATLGKFAESIEPSGPAPVCADLQ